MDTNVTSTGVKLRIQSLSQMVFGILAKTDFAESSTSGSLATVVQSIRTGDVPSLAIRFSRDVYGPEKAAVRDVRLTIQTTFGIPSEALRMRILDSPASKLTARVSLASD